MGNSIGRGRKKAKVMMITGETFKLRIPVLARDALAGHPGHVLLDSDAVKQFGVRARALDPGTPLKPGKLYFLVQLPPAVSSNSPAAPRRVRSGVHMTAKDRLECLMLSRRSASELPIARSSSTVSYEGHQVKMRLSKAEMDKLVEGSRDQREVVEKILKLYMRDEGGAAELNHVDPDLTHINRASVGAHIEKRVRFNPTGGGGEITEVLEAL